MEVQRVDEVPYSPFFADAMWGVEEFVSFITQLVKKVFPRVRVVEEFPTEKVKTTTIVWFIRHQSPAEPRTREVARYRLESDQGYETIHQIELDTFVVFHIVGKSGEETRRLADFLRRIVYEPRYREILKTMGILEIGLNERRDARPYLGRAEPLPVEQVEIHIRVVDQYRSLKPFVSQARAFVSVEEERKKLTIVRGEKGRDTDDFTDQIGEDERVLSISKVIFLDREYVAFIDFIPLRISDRGYSAICWLPYGEHPPRGEKYEVEIVTTKVVLESSL